MNKLDSYTPLGYSLCGVVVEVGAGVPTTFAVGDLVACAGNEHALHAELNWVPRTSTCPCPPVCAAEHAAFGTVGAIAMHGVRRGEVAARRAALRHRARPRRAARRAAARRLRGPGRRRRPGPGPLRTRRDGSARWSARRPDGIGRRRGRRRRAHRRPRRRPGVPRRRRQHATSPVELAAQLARDRARVVDIGKCSLDLPWNAYYEKELDVRFSRSYGPGRYDDRYELDGVDYPIGYVRWTERRNLECFLDLLARGSLDVEPLVSARSRSTTRPTSTPARRPAR